MVLYGSSHHSTLLPAQEVMTVFSWLVGVIHYRTVPTIPYSYLRYYYLYVTTRVCSTSVRINCESWGYSMQCHTPYNSALGRAFSSSSHDHWTNCDGHRARVRHSVEFMVLLYCSRFILTIHLRTGHKIEEYHKRPLHNKTQRSVITTEIPSGAKDIIAEQVVNEEFVHKQHGRQQPLLSIP